jgi:cation:H+ antiporter
MNIILLLLGGLVLLVAGGELLVRGSVKVAERLGVSPLVIGLTLVGFGTSTPELVTSVQAALGGFGGVAYGNIVGSNLANILLIVGVTAIICPIGVASKALKRDGLTMLGVAVIFAVLAALVPIGRPIGLVFVLALASYIFLAFWQERNAPVLAQADHGAFYDKGVALRESDPALARPAAQGSLLVPLGLAAAGIAAVVGGGMLLVEGAVGLARLLGISETVIGLTVVALGTSLPELVTSVMAALRKQTDVAFGNIVGSNIYNILGIGGVTALVAPTEVPPEIVGFDNLVMVAVSALLIVFAHTGRTLARSEGGVLLALYAGYVWWIWP